MKQTMVDIRNFENQAKENNHNSSVKNFIAERDRVIKFLLDNRWVMEKEYKSLQERMTPSSEDAFKKKCLGWSKVLNGAELLEKMYFESIKDDNTWS